MIVIYPELVEFQLAASWVIKKNSLYNLDPSDCRLSDVYLPNGFSIWDFYFIDDLFMAENNEQKLVLDISWIGHELDDAHYKIVLLSQEISFNQKPSYNWDNPVIERKSRSLSDVVKWVHELTRR
jgi:hypothetical protein